MKLIFISILFLISTIASANNYFCTDQLEQLPILQGGRVKPLYVHASETIKSLTGSTKFGDNSATINYCLLSLNGMGLQSTLNLEARIDHVDIMNFLGLEKNQHYIKYEQLLSIEDAIKAEMRISQSKGDSYQKAFMKLFSNLNKYKEIKSGNDWLFAELKDGKIEWQPLTVFLTEEKVISQKSVSPTDPFIPVLFKSKYNYDSVNGDKYEAELFYAKAGLASWALLLTILSLASLVLFKSFTITLILSSISAIVQLVLIAMRVYISGRAPITNMYETVMFSGFGSLLLALVLGHFKKDQIYVYMGLAYNVCTLMMLNFANGMLTATISPLVPVLRDNFWLSTHVTTVILSYGALALSWILANTVLLRSKFGTISSKEVNHFSEIIYTTLKWGTTMLAAGIILGGVWADYSWGRFWGWDPKETWSLIVLCVYMIILHGRYTSWIKTNRFIALTAGAFMSVMMAWFGVNYILATGLHSYGFSEGGAIFLGTFFTIQIVILVMTKNNSTKEELVEQN